MTDQEMALLELVEKAAGADLVREMKALAADRIMDAEVEANDGAILRLNDEWAAARRYMALETIARVTDSATAGCTPRPPEPRPNLRGPALLHDQPGHDDPGVRFSLRP